LIIHSLGARRHFEEFLTIVLTPYLPFYPPNRLL
jgi:hypothetical protein